MRAGYSSVSGRGFTLVELLVTITIVAALAALSFSVVKRAGIRADLVSSVSRVRDLGPMLHAYSQDSGGRLPVWKAEDTYWWEMIADPNQYDPERFFKSPGHREFDPNRVDATISYGWNASVMGRSREADLEGSDGERRMANFRRPASVLVLADGAKEEGFGLIEPGGPLPDPGRYDGRVAALMLDGSVKVMMADMDFKADSGWFEVKGF